MLKNRKNLFVVALITVCLAAQAQAGVRNCYLPAKPASASTQSKGVIYKVVQTTPKYNLQRPEVISGARVTLFANFLQKDPGCVLFNLNGTSTECTLNEWKPNSVTVEIPRLGLAHPKNAEIQIVLPNGRVAKTFSVVLISQPDIMIHEDTVPQPTPPAPTTQAAVYAMPVQGGLMLQAGTQ